jgi:hypothetical protein
MKPQRGHGATKVAFGGNALLAAILTFNISYFYFIYYNRNMLRRLD